MDGGMYMAVEDERERGRIAVGRVLRAGVINAKHKNSMKDEKQGCP